MCRGGARALRGTLQNGKKVLLCRKRHRSRSSEPELKVTTKG
ncbi:hypothetical protein GEOBRER4_n3111 [Citrifermentans bremense]|uniref:Uncharacterized protein n=1 Tax=Citrifermentans bremense TaxID=60035 RepID=A0A7R7FSG7_9BACT|nr:hypothetical protein GEOBRER4_n3111 [Citrifermentans bremense]